MSGSQATVLPTVSLPTFLPLLLASYLMSLHIRGGAI